MDSRRLLSLGFVIILTIVLVWGFSIVGSPAQNKAKNLDSMRRSDISTFGYAINNYYDKHCKLPANLADTKDYNYNDNIKLSEFEYKPLNKKEYEICSTFLADYEPQNDYGEKAHTAGRFCYKKNVNSWSSCDQKK